MTGGFRGQATGEIRNQSVLASRISFIVAMSGQNETRRFRSAAEFPAMTGA